MMRINNVLAALVLVLAPSGVAAAVVARGVATRALPRALGATRDASAARASSSVRAVAMMAGRPNVKPGSKPAKSESEPAENNSKRNQSILFGLVIFGLLYDYFITHDGLHNFNPAHTL
ncbi:hypothetical protein T492DRAFT_1022645, partial [Pavlovales sp. CCMP2436]